MASTYTTNFGFEKIGTGDKQNTWGATERTTLDLIDDAIGGVTTVSLTGGNTTLTTTDGTDDSGRASALLLSGTLSSNATVTVPKVDRAYFVENNTTGAYTAGIKTSTSSALDIPQGTTCIVRVNATDDDVTFFSVPASATTGTPFAVGVTDGGVMVGDGSTFVLETGSTLRTSIGAQAQGDVLDDLNTLGANTADSEFLVGTGAGALAWESGATVRTSLGLGAIATNATINDDDWSGTDLAIGNGGTGASTAAAAFAALEQAATTSATGTVELATTAETTTGTDTARVVTPDGLAGSAYGTAVLPILVFDDATDVATGDGAGDIFWRVPSTLNGWDLVGVAACVQTAGTTNTTDIQVHNVTDAVDMLSTVITIDSAETDSSTAATPAVIDTDNDDVATGDQIRIDVDAVSTTAPKGLLVELQFRVP